MGLLDRSKFNPTKRALIIMVGYIIFFFASANFITYTFTWDYMERKQYDSFVFDYKTITNNTQTNYSTYCINPLPNKDIAAIYTSSDNNYELDFISQGSSVAIFPISQERALIINQTQVYKNITGCIAIVWFNNASMNDLSYEIKFQNTGQPDVPQYYWENKYIFFFAFPFGIITVIGPFLCVFKEEIVSEQYEDIDKNVEEQK